MPILPLAELKKWARVETDDEDAQLLLLANAIDARVSQYTGVPVPPEIYWISMCWGWPNSILFNIRHPVADGRLHLRYRDTDGAEQTLSLAQDVESWFVDNLYSVGLISGARLTLRAKLFADIEGADNAAAAYCGIENGLQPSAVPEQWRLVIWTTFATLYDNREDAPMPDNSIIDALIRPITYRGAV